MKRTVALTDFANLPTSPWQTFIKGSGLLAPTRSFLRFGNEATDAEQYTNAQLDDYQGLARRDFLWQPPLSLRVRARFSHPAGQLKGTAGFGFWNDPFMMTGFRRPTLPRAVWFFYSSPPSDMKLDLQTPGYGWKAATIDALRWPFFLLAPTAPLAIPLMNLSFLYRLCWPLAQRAIQVSEALIPATMTEWHTYELVWHARSVNFMVDGMLLLAAKTAPRGPLGFVMWLDNQFMVVTPWGRFGYGLIAEVETQWMDVRELVISMR